MRPIRVRWLAFRGRDAAMFHATYAALAETMPAEGPPAILWGRAPRHLCLGQSQTLADVDPRARVRVLRRPLGGGAVWVDRAQVCYALVAPRAMAPQRPSEWSAWALAPALETFRALGLPVTRQGEDLWVRGRKIAGSGAATIGGAAVVASSFLMRFPARRFAEVVAVPSKAFRSSLHRALPRAMTDWTEEGVPPTDGLLAATFRASLRATLGWQALPSRLRAREREACTAWLEELLEPLEPGVMSRVPDGLKLNAAMTLRQRGDAVELVSPAP